MLQSNSPYFDPSLPLQKWHLLGQWTLANPTKLAHEGNERPWIALQRQLHLGNTDSLQDLPLFLSQAEPFEDSTSTDRLRRISGITLLLCVRRSGDDPGGDGFYARPLNNFQWFLQLNIFSSMCSFYGEIRHLKNGFIMNFWMAGIFCALQHSKHSPHNCILIPILLSLVLPKLHI